MRKLYFITLLLLFAFRVPAQQWDWAIQSSGTDNETGNKICVDNTGNIYLAGVSTGNMTLGGTQTPQGSFVAKLNSSQQCVWSKILPGPASAIASTPQGDLLVTGTFTGSAQFGSFAISSHGSKDIYLTRISSAGAIAWINTMGGPNEDESGPVAVDLNGNVLVAGKYDNSLYFGNLLYPTAGSLGAFMAAYTSNGAYINAECMYSYIYPGPNTEGHIYPSVIMVDAANNAHLAGTYSGMAVFQDDTLEVYYTNMFIATYAPGAAYSAVRERGLDKATSIRSAFLGDSSNVFMCGWGGSQYGGWHSLFKFNDQLGTRWGATFCHPNWCTTEVKGAARDQNGNVYVAFNYVDSVEYNNQWTQSGGQNDIMLAKYSDNGTFQWVKHTGLSGDDIVNDLCIDNNGYCYITGSFSSQTDFDNHTLSAPGAQHKIFIARLGTGVPTTVEAQVPEEKTAIYPNPSKGIIVIEGKNITGVAVYDMLGNRVYEESSIPNHFQLDLSGHVKGLYFVEVSKGKAREIKKIVIE